MTFKKGDNVGKSYWLGKKRDPETNEKIRQKLIGRKTPLEVCQKLSEMRKGKGNANWKGDEVGYIGIHQWLRRTFKKKMICEHCGKIGIRPIDIHWAKLPDMAYERKRENFIELCALCHVRMDKIYNKYRGQSK